MLLPSLISGYLEETSVQTARANSKMEAYLANRIERLSYTYCWFVGNKCCKPEACVRLKAKYEFNIKTVLAY